MLMNVDSVQASAKKSAAREALVYFEQFEHFQADGTDGTTSNLSDPRGNPEIHTLWQRLAFGRV